MSDAEFSFSTIVRTDAGMCALWDPVRFQAIDDFTKWEAAFDSDEAIEVLITESTLVPLNVGGDGTFAVSVGHRALNERERAVLTVSSRPYLFVSTGTVQLGGIEQVGSFAGGAAEFEFPTGAYSATIHLIDWQADPASVNERGEATPDALPDFVVELRQIEGTPAVAFRTSAQTFERAVGGDRE